MASSTNTPSPHDADGVFGTYSVYLATSRATVIEQFGVAISTDDVFDTHNVNGYRILLKQSRDILLKQSRDLSRRGRPADKPTL